MATLVKNHDWYYLQFYNKDRNPKRKRVPLKTKTKRTAEQIMAFGNMVIKSLAVFSEFDVLIFHCQFSSSEVLKKVLCSNTMKKPKTGYTISPCKKTSILCSIKIMKAKKIKSAIEMPLTYSHNLVIELTVNIQ